ncbi:MAG: hypothetical protein OQL20_06890 [Sedimenticola sp.]|nr:hypothetical protein [Sedimenticola sp.]
MLKKIFRSTFTPNGRQQAFSVSLPHLANCHVASSRWVAILRDNGSSEYGVVFMGGTLWFINLLKDQPLIGFLIGLVFVTVMFGSKNLVIYFYSRSKERQQKNKE